VCCYAECHLCQVSLMLSFGNKSIMLTVVVLSFIMLCVAMLNAIYAKCHLC